MCDSVCLTEGGMEGEDRGCSEVRHLWIYGGTTSIFTSLCPPSYAILYLSHSLPLTSNLSLFVISPLLFMLYPLHRFSTLSNKEQRVPLSPVYINEQNQYAAVLCISIQGSQQSFYGMIVLSNSLKVPYCK